MFVSDWVPHASGQPSAQELRRVAGGGTGASYSSFTVEADSGRTAGSRWRGVLALYASPPALEIRVKRMCRTPPYNRRDYRDRLTASLQALGIPRLDREADLSSLRPEIPLSELTADHLDRILALIDQWITDVRQHSAEPEVATGAALGDATGKRATGSGLLNGQHHAAWADSRHFSRAHRARAADHYRRAGKWYMRGTRRLAEYREAVRLDPGNAGYRYALAGRLHDAGKIAEAKAEYQEAIHLEPHNISYRYALGMLLNQQEVAAREPGLERPP